MTRPISPMFFIGVFLLIVIAAVIMLSSVIGRHAEDRDRDAVAAQAVIAEQLTLLKVGDWETLRATFTERVRDQITKDYVAKKKPGYEGVAVGALVGRVELGEVETSKDAIVWTPEGQSLTRLVLVDGRWLADDLWFR